MTNWDKISLESVGKYIAVNETSKNMLISNQEYRTSYANLIFSQSQSLLNNTNNAKSTTINNAPPNILGWKGFNQVGILTMALQKSRKNMSITANSKQTIAYAKIEIFVIFLISVILLTSYLVVYFIGISYYEKNKSNFNKLKCYLRIDLFVKEY